MKKKKRRYQEDKPQLISVLSDLSGVFVVKQLVRLRLRHHFPKRCVRIASCVRPNYARFVGRRRYGRRSSACTTGGRPGNVRLGELIDGEGGLCGNHVELGELWVSSHSGRVWPRLMPSGDGDGDGDTQGRRRYVTRQPCLPAVSIDSYLHESKKKRNPRHGSEQLFSSKRRIKTG